MKSVVDVIMVLLSIAVVSSSSIFYVNASANDLEDMVNVYMNFGASSSNPDEYNCSKWVALFTNNGTAHAPGAPPASGSKELNEDCEMTRKLFKHLTAYSKEILPVTDGDSKKLSRVAFNWEIVGILAPPSPGTAVHVPAITTWEMDPTGTKILHAIDYFDPSPLSV